MKGNEVESQGNQNASIRKLWGRSELPSSRAAGLIGPDCGIRTLPFGRVTVWFSKLCWVLQSKRKGQYLSNIPTLQDQPHRPSLQQEAKGHHQQRRTNRQHRGANSTQVHYQRSLLSPSGRGNRKIPGQSTITTHRQRHEQMVQQALPFPTWTLERQ